MNENNRKKRGANTVGIKLRTLNQLFGQEATIQVEKKMLLNCGYEVLDADLPQVVSSPTVGLVKQELTETAESVPIKATNF